MSASLPKSERVSGKKAVDTLLKKGKWERTPHLRCCYLTGNGLEFNRVMVSVPKRNFKRAVRRNLLKRRMREAYRQQKELLAPKGIDLLFVYNDASLADYSVIRDEVAVLLQKIAA